MSALSASTSNNSSNLQQLKDEAIALEASKDYHEAYAKYEEVDVIQQATLGPAHADTMETLMSMDKVIEKIKYWL